MIEKRPYFNNEAQTLVSLSKQLPDIPTAVEGMTMDFNYNDFLNLSYLHRVLPLVFYHINDRQELSQRFPTTTKEFGRIISKAQEYRTASLLRHAKDVFKELNNAGARFVLFRGLLLATTVYNDPAWRNLEDIDLLIEEDSTGQIDAILRDLGYVQGSFDADSKKVIPYTKEQLDFWVKDRQHLGSYLLLTNDPFTAAVKIDVHYKVTNAHDSFLIHGKDLLSKTRKTHVLGTNVEAVDINDLLILLCVHIHSHSKWLYEMRDYNDLHLSRFTDIFEVVKKYRSVIDWDLLIERTRKFGVHYPVSMGLIWATRLYGDFIPKEVLAVIKPKDFESREREIGLRDKFDDTTPVAKWQEDFTERLFNPNRYDRVIELTGIPQEPDTKTHGLSHYHF